MGVWSESRQNAARDWPKGAVKVAVRGISYFRPETIELSRKTKAAHRRYSRAWLAGWQVSMAERRGARFSLLVKSLREVSVGPAP